MNGQSLKDIIMTIDIFGDSFAAKRDPDHEFMGQTGELWYNIVSSEMKEKIQNFARDGSGPYTAFENFYNKFENNLLSDKIIFVLSCQYRFPIDEDNQPVCLDVLQGVKNTVLDYLEYEIFYTNKIFKEEIFRANIKNIYFLKTLSQIFKIKILIFLGFGFNRWHLHEYVDLVKKYKLKNLNDDNFKISLKPLYHVCIEESDQEKDYDDHFHFRANHLSFCNHRILANKVLNFFNNTDLNEKWHKHFLNTWNNSYDGRSHFIYE